MSESFYLDIEINKNPEQVFLVWIAPFFLSERALYHQQTDFIMLVSDAFESSLTTVSLPIFVLFQLLTVLCSPVVSVLSQSTCLSVKMSVSWYFGLSVLSVCMLATPPDGMGSVSLGEINKPFKTIQTGQIIIIIIKNLTCVWWNLNFCPSFVTCS